MTDRELMQMAYFIDAPRLAGHCPEYWEITDEVKE